MIAIRKLIYFRWRSFSFSRRKNTDRVVSYVRWCVPQVSRRKRWRQGAYCCDHVTIPLLPDQVVFGSTAKAVPVDRCAVFD